MSGCSRVAREFDSDQDPLLQVDEPFGLPPWLVDWLLHAGQVGNRAVVEVDSLVEPLKTRGVAMSCLPVKGADDVDVVLGHLQPVWPSCGGRGRLSPCEEVGDSKKVRQTSV